MAFCRSRSLRVVKQISNYTKINLSSEFNQHQHQRVRLLNLAAVLVTQSRAEPANLTVHSSGTGATTVNFTKSIMTSDAQTMNQEDKIDNRPNTEENGSHSQLEICKRILAPPARKGMTSLDKAAFEKEIDIPTITVPATQIGHFMRHLKPYVLKVGKFQNLIPIEGTNKKKVLLDPDNVGADLEHFLTNVAKIEMDPEVRQSAAFEMFTFTFDHWSYREIIDAILPDDQEKFSGYSATGHVVHVNLREHLLPYRFVIGAILLDKIAYAKTVVNKLEEIDSTYRNFKMEFLAGDRNTVVTMKENKNTFEFDFATVYWNSRLSTEHDRIVGILEPCSVVFDVFAGVGPFAIPAARKKCTVLANDLNPESTKWLARNIQHNKVSERVQVFNKDGRDFLREDVAKYLKDAFTSEEELKSRKFHVIMNLPAIAVEFLDAFWNLLGADVPTPPDFKLTVHVYCFIKDVSGYKEKALQLVKDNVNFDLKPDDVIEVSSVRNVAPNKEMLRVSFNVPHEILRNLAPTSTSTSTSQPQVSQPISSEELPSEGAGGLKRKLADTDT